MTEEIRVLLVDDQPLIRMGFRLLLDATPGLRVVGEAGDGAEAVRRVEELRPDVVLMDVRMPGLDGIAATGRVVARSPGTRVLVLTTFDLDEYAFGAVRAGAGGFLLKDAEPEQLVAAIRALHAGDAVLAPRVTGRMLELFGHRLPAPGTDADPAAALTEREREVFLAIAAGLTNLEIARRLTVSESTVKTHVGRVLAKLGARDRVHAVILAYEWGLAGAGPDAGG